MGCESSYEKFYVDESFDTQKWIETDRLAETPVIYASSGDFDIDQRSMFENGYLRIGSVSFNGPIAAIEISNRWRNICHSDSDVRMDSRVQIPPDYNLCFFT